VLSGKTINLRITKKQIKNAKVKYGIDLQVLDVGNMQNQKVMQLMQDPLFLTECFYAFYEEQLVQHGITPDMFDELVDDTNIDELRERFIKACAAFFPLLRILSTSFAATLNGNPSEMKPAENLET
jgi:hypothetical protein